MKKEGFSIPWMDVLRIAGISHIGYIVLLFLLAVLVEKERIPLELLKGFVSCAAACAFFLSVLITGREVKTGRLLLCGLSAAGFLLPLAILGLAWQPEEFIGWFLPLAVLVGASALAASLLRGRGKRQRKPSARIKSGKGKRR